MQSQKINKAIISTLIRYKTEGSPCLSLLEIYKHLTLDAGLPAIRIQEIYNFLNNNSLIKAKNGFYWLTEENEDNFEKRISAAKTTGQKIKKAKRISRLLKTIPYIKSIAVSGSVSMTNPKPESDVDFFIISQKNRIWLTRFLTILLTHLVGQRRYKENINNKICLNLYIADEKTIFPIQNIASSHMISRMLPIYQKDSFNAFLNTNKTWISKFIHNFNLNFIFNAHPKKTDVSPQGKLINIFEQTLAKLMSERMAKKTPLAKPPHLIANNSALIFYYPHSKNQEILEKYDNTLALYKDKI